MNRPVHVLVVGSGIFGVWTALELLRRGARVTLLDAWGAGHARSSSGGDTRIIRATYGSHAIYTRMARRALERWQAYESQWQAGLLQQTGAVWLVGEDSRFARCIGGDARRGRHPVRRADRCAMPHAAIRRWRSRVWRACGSSRRPDTCSRAARARTSPARFMAEGGTCRVAAAASPVSMDADGVLLTDGGVVSADHFVFACGPWLGDPLPGHRRRQRQADAAGGLLLRHAGRRRAVPRRCPAGLARVWDRGSSTAFPAGDGRGFKVADDSPGPVMDPTSDERVPTVEGISRRARVSRDAVPGAAGCSAARRRRCVSTRPRPTRTSSSIGIPPTRVSGSSAGIRPRLQDGAGRRRYGRCRGARASRRRIRHSHWPGSRPHRRPGGPQMVVTLRSSPLYGGATFRRRCRADSRLRGAGGRVYLGVPDGRCPPFVRKWRNWQTRKPQELVAARSWRFESSLPHHPLNR